MQAAGGRRSILLFSPLLHPGGLLVSEAALYSEGHRFNPCNSQSVHQQLCAQLERPWRWHCSLIYWLLFDCFKMELLQIRMISLSLFLTSMHVWELLNISAYVCMRWLWNNIYGNIIPINQHKDWQCLVLYVEALQHSFTPLEPQTHCT